MGKVEVVAESHQRDLYRRKSEKKELDFMGHGMTHDWEKV